jgi:transcriptional regulator with XRE-family HTH domain
MAEQPLRPNRRLRLQRRLRGWSQEDVAAGLYRVASATGETDLGVDATMVSRWERGTRRPRPRYVRLLCQLFDLPAEQLGLVQGADLELVPLLPGDRLEGSEVERRDFLHGVASLFGMASLSPVVRASAPGLEPMTLESWERLERALNQPGRVDRETVDHLERMTHALESLEPTLVSARALLGPATGHLDAISMLLQASPPSHLRSRLCALAGETACLVGWLRGNLDDPDGAAACFRIGLRAATEANDRALGAYLVGSAACRYPSREDPQATIRMLTGTASPFAQVAATPATRAWLAAKEADAWAKLGRESECLRALDRAAEIVDRLGGDDPAARRPLFSLISPTWMEGERGATLTKLGQDEMARDILHPVVASLGATNDSNRLWLLAALASAHIGLDEPEEASRLARTALIGAARRHQVPVIHLVVGLRDRLHPHRRNLAVQELDEQLRALVPNPMSRR